MNKKDQQNLIKKIIKSDKPNQECDEFKKLQMHWYDKVESKTDYNDIERTGTNRHKYYDEYGGLIKHYSWSITDKYDFATHEYYQILRKISWNARVVSTSKLFDASKPSKTHKLTTLQAKIALQQPTTSSKPIKNSKHLNKTIKSQKLSKVDTKILYLAGNGHSIKYISNFLRTKMINHASLTKTGEPRINPFSVYYVHHRLKQLLEAIQAGQVYEAGKDGEVRKTGLALDSYIYTNNNND